MAGKDAILGVVRPRNTLGASAAVLAAAEVMHLAHAAPVEVGLASLVAAGFTGWRAGGKPAAVVGAGGAWLAVATAAGPFTAGVGLLWHPLEITWAAGALAALWALDRHAAIRAAKAWRAAKAQWLEDAPGFGLFRSHLLDFQETRLGEMLEVDVSETSKRSSALPNSSLAEDIATKRKLPRHRVRVTEGAISGRIRISIRTRDPWKHAIPHPLLDSAREIDLPVPASIRKPLTVGQDPETGKPLGITLYDSHGGKNVYIIGKRDAGKTTLLDCLRERLTACPDALIFGINLSKASEDNEWAPACHLTAIGEEPGQVKKALAILQLVSRIITETPMISRDTKVRQVSAEWPAVVLIIDEIDALVDLLGQRAKLLLRHITGKGRSEAVSFIAAGQRGTADWMGGADVRANLDVVCAGRVRRQAEIAHAVGSMAPLIPDMATYGQGHAGVWAIVTDSGDYTLGRSFNLDDLVQLRQFAYDRRRPEMELNSKLSDRIGELYTALRAMQLREYHGDYLGEAAAALFPPLPRQAGGEDEESPETGDTLTITRAPVYGEPGDALDRELEQSLDPELREQRDKIRQTNAETRKIHAENPLPDMSGIPESDLEAFHEARWAQAAMKTVITADQRARLMELLAGEGTTIKAVAEDLGVKPTKARCMLWKLKLERVAYVDGKGRGQRWKLGQPTGGGDEQ